MLDELKAAQAWLELHPWVYTAVALALLALVSWLASWVTKHILLRGLHKLLRSPPLGQSPDVSVLNVVSRLSKIIPALIVSMGVKLVPGLPDGARTVVINVCGAFVALTVALAIGEALNLLVSVYQRRPDADKRPIKGYVQVVKIAVYTIASILIIAMLIDRSPLILLSGLGAMAAVLMLIFQDTLLSLVASVQITSADMVRVGDWIEMPQLNANGYVIDLALHTVKVQNWDKTITTIPVKRLITESFHNWRGMFESGGRRIKRSIYLDQHSVRFLTDDERAGLHRFSLIADYLDEKEAEIEAWNARLLAEGKDAVNLRRVTNIGTFRAYMLQYLRTHPRIHQDMTLLVRQMNPTSDGLPLELYCFTNTTVWAEYEGIQSDIFDHIFAILPEFGLRTFQHPSGADMRGLSRAACGEKNNFTLPDSNQNVQNNI